MLSIFKRKGWGELNQKRDRQREKKQPHKLVHSDTLCIRTKTDCSATHLCISFIYLQKMDTERFKY